ncbi:MAG: sulfite exporter TauE/SafE family protein [Pseudomonadales bacterium]|nr:sulfite exporter TauE/SafE family protein [Pseudomonadales bacterium]
MISDYPFVVAFTLGLMGSTHCIGMCGGIMGAMSSLTLDQTVHPLLRHRWTQLLLYNFGRILTYSLIGLLFGALSGTLINFGSAWELVFRIVAGVTLILMGLYLAGFGAVMRLFESSGQHMWKYIQPYTVRFMPPRNMWQLALLGALWGWLPCGMVYSALIWSGAQGSALSSGILMFCFGLGTLPALLFSGSVTGGLAKLLSDIKFRRMLGIIIILYGVWTLYGATVFSSMSHDNHGTENQHHSHRHH